MLTIKAALVNCAHLIRIGLKWKDLMIKYKTPCHYRFPLANLHSGETIYFVPEVKHWEKFREVVY
jgi:hypothetical protein